MVGGFVVFEERCMDACQQYHATHIAGTCPWCGKELFPHARESTVRLKQRICYDDQGGAAWHEEEVVSNEEAEPGEGEPGNPEERPLVRLLVLVVRESIRMGITRAHFTSRDGGAIEMHSPDGRMVAAGTEETAREG
jgi:hypothetical protein